ncbi:3-isopropylmalate/(R)-2-methylmalate dehydratase large subunit [Shinella sp. BE166]|uniref:3-isopropylmalate dehydratase large subunit n=1 Tax=Shinella lacus TaxID=2654216 RepID=A0ABT1QZQ4_9HYPH|nr:aconitase/3-isopropylmalate dehydratase large subunit family protein [Shinella lacus]MCQ4628394.1 3-isopropylmalate dehydratase large subunit [Shinella lacus]
MHALAKIIAAHAGRDSVQVGEIVNVEPDLIMLNDRGAARARALLAEMGGDKVFDPERVVVVFDHHYPAIRPQDAEAQKVTRVWTKAQAISKFHAGEGIGHVLFPEKGYARPGSLIFGTDSHTVTNGALGCFSTGLGHSDIASGLALGYNWLRVPEVLRVVLHGELKPWVTAKDIVLKIAQDYGEDAAVYQAVEFTGPLVRSLCMDERLVLTNMVIDFGAKAGYIQPDEITFDYLRSRQVTSGWTVYETDGEADYARTIEIDVTELDSLVALPHDLSNVVTAGEAAHIEVDEAIFGTCTGGRINDFRLAAEIMRGRHVADNCRMMVNPGSADVFQQAMREGLIQIMVEAGAVIGVPGCGPCTGCHQGMMAAGEMGITSASRNFRGRMGSPDSSLIVASPATVAASAIAGHVVSPSEFLVKQ